MKRIESNNIEEKVNKTLTALDNYSSKALDDFFYTRLSNRMQNIQSKDSLAPFILSKSVIKYAAVVLFVIVNLYSLFSVINDKDTISYKREDYLMSMAEEYQLYNASFDVLLREE